MRKLWITGGLLGLIAVLVMAMSCSAKPKAVFVQRNATAIVKGYGYAWGENAEEQAKELALKEAAMIADPNSVHYTYMHEEPYTIFRTRDTSKAEAKIVGVQETADGGFMAIAEANRSGNALKKIMYTRYADITIVEKSLTLKDRLNNAYTMAVEEAIKQSAMYKYDKVPAKMRGDLTFHSIERLDNGKTLKLRMMVYVGFVGQGDLSKEEKAMVYMNAWRQACIHNKGEMAKVLYEKAIKFSPNADYYEEFAAWAIANKHLRDAVTALEAANRENQYSVKYLSKLYQLYKTLGDTGKAQAAEAKLIELEAFDDNIGADISSGFEYKSKVKWEEQGNDQPEGMIYFRDISDEELEAQIKGARERQE